MLRAHIWKYLSGIERHILEIEHISDIRVLWELHGGVRTVEIDIALNSYSAFLIYNAHLGSRLVIVDQYIDRPVADTYITGVSLSPTGVHIVANGPWFRHSDELYNFDDTSQDSTVADLAYNPTGQSFQDSGQDFSEWETTSGSSIYEIQVTNSDTSVTTGFLGAAFTTSGTNDSIYVYQDYALSTPGWLGVDPDGKTPIAYTVILCYNYKTTTDIIKDSLSEVPILHSGHEFVEETSTVIGFWEPAIEEGGMYPAEIIEKLASLSDSTNRQWNYYAEAGGFRSGVPTDPIPYFSAQNSTGNADWAIHSWTIKKGSFTAERNIQEMRNKIRVAYSDMENYEELTLYPDDGSYVEDDDSQLKYWDREVMLSGGDSYLELAEYYADLYISKFGDSMFISSFTISAPYIQDMPGGKWPLWIPIKLNKSYFRFMDMFPNSSSTALAWDRIYVSQASTMEYSSANNELRIVLDTEDNSLDAMLARISAFE